MGIANPAILAKDHNPPLRQQQTKLRCDDLNAAPIHPDMLLYEFQLENQECAPMLRTFVLAAALTGFCAAPGGAVDVPYDTSSEYRYTFSWAGLGLIDAIDGDSTETSWTVDVPSGGGSYMFLGGYISTPNSPVGAASYDLYINGSKASDWYSAGVSGASGLLFTYGSANDPFDSKPLNLLAGIHVFELKVTGVGAGSGGGLMIFSNDIDTIPPIPAPPALGLMAAAAGALSAAAVGRWRGFKCAAEERYRTSAARLGREGELRCR